MSEHDPTSRLGWSDSDLGPDDIPHHIGTYRVLQVLGEGGMGIVYEAEQTDPVRRRVALKVLRLGMDRQMLARFEAERQALAVMDHPNIATVLGGGVMADGRPYFAMEVVRGVKLTDYCDGNKLSVRERLGLFISVCEAIQHAHQKGVIHRDIKPSNILVADYDGKPVPKVIDFGIAKAIGQQLTERTLVTEHGITIGTPAYMSSEQAEMSGLDVDTRTDIYSLGVVLYELLLGRLPLDPDRMSAAEFLQRLVLPDTPHPTPSSQVSALGDDADVISGLRGVDRQSLRRELRGDLDAIIIKTMEQDRNRRYQTANGLALDLRRYLASEPVVARAPSPAYRFRKFVRRNRFAVAGVAIVVASILIGFAATAAALARATRAEAAAAREASVAQQVTDYLVDLFAGADPSETLGDTISVRTILDRGAQTIDAELADQPFIQTRLFSAIGTVYQSLGLFAESEAMLLQALAIRERELDSLDINVALSLEKLGQLYRHSGDLRKAEPLLLRARMIYEHVLGPGHREVADADLNLGNLYFSQRRYAEAEILMLQAVEEYTQLGAIDPANDPELASALSNLGAVYIRMQRYDTAAAVIARALDIRERVLPTGDPGLASTMNNLGALYWSLGQYEDAEPLYQRALSIYRNLYGEEHPYTASALNNLGETYWALGRYDESEDLLRRALAIKQRVYDTDHTSIGNTLNTLGNLLRDKGEYLEAETFYRDALALRERALGLSAPDVAETLAEYAKLLRILGRDAEASRHEARAEAIRGS